MYIFNQNFKLNNILLASIWGSLFVVKKNNISTYKMQST